MIPTPNVPVQQYDSPPDNPAANESLWADQLAANILLTVQALQRLHTALDEKFTR